MIRAHVGSLCAALVVSLMVGFSPDGLATRAFAQDSQTSVTASSSGQPAAEDAVPAVAPQASEAPVQVQDALISSVQQRIDNARERLNAFARRVDANAENDRALSELGIEIGTLVRELLVISVDLRPRLNELQLRLGELGAAPEEGQSSEAPDLTEERNRLNGARAQINALTGQAEDLSIAGRALADRIIEMRRALFTEQLFAHTEISGDVFSQAAESFSSALQSMQRSIVSWMSFVIKFKTVPLSTALFLSFALAIVILIVEYRLFGSLIHRDPGIEDPSYMSRLSVAFWSTILPSMAIGVFLSATYFLLETFNVLRADIAPIIASLLAVIGLVFFVAMLARSVLAPFAPNWRLVRLSNRGAQNLSLAVVLMALVNGIDYVFATMSAAFSSPVVLTVMKSLVSSMIVGLLIFVVSFLRPVLATDGNPYSPGRPWPRTIAYGLRLLGLLLMAAGALGYVGMARFLATQVVLTGAVIVTMYIGILSGKAISAPNQFGETRVGRALSKRFSLTPVALDQAGILAGLLIYAFALVTGIPLILISWGFQPSDLQVWLVNLFTEVNIGTIRISIFGIMGGVALFAVGLVVTRWLQKWLDGNVMARSQVDAGVRNSVKTGIGYLGTAIAGIIGVSAAGIDLSSLALVAGALSLGIGFGLQNIVSNFVSGLILLVERPFKVGDWVATSTTEGFVKRISVRATEIETFQRQSIIVPNSELINSPVGNWTHRNKLGRIEIPVSVSYDSDPRRVMEVLQEIVDAHPGILRNPAPAVMFTAFGESSLDFEIRAFIGDVLDGWPVRNAIRLAVVERFRAEGIEMPYPHREVRLHVAKDLSDADTPGSRSRKGSGKKTVSQLPLGADDDKVLS
nr:mechanosensitive ion channel family protein [Peteryoungia desertarenae]